MNSLDERARLLLKILVERYIDEGQPVGSRTLSKASGLDLSPATIRNVMSDLEELGLIASPHTSAGRIPTARGYRLFVDTMLTVKHEDLHAPSLAPEQPQKVIANAANLLSNLSHFVGVVMAPRRSTVFRHIEFLRLSDRRLLILSAALALFNLANGSNLVPAEEALISQWGEAPPPKFQAPIFPFPVEKGGEYLDPSLHLSRPYQESLAAEQTRFAPQLENVKVKAPPAETYGAAIKVVREQLPGWAVVLDDTKQVRAEMVESRLPFRLASDIVLEVRNDPRMPNDSEVAIRCRPRLPDADLGNCLALVDDLRLRLSIALKSLQADLEHKAAMTPPPDLAISSTSTSTVSLSTSTMRNRITAGMPPLRGCPGHLQSICPCCTVTPIQQPSLIVLVCSCSCSCSPALPLACSTASPHSPMRSAPATTPLEFITIAVTTSTVCTSVEFNWRLVCHVKAGCHDFDFEHEHRFTEHEHDENLDFFGKYAFLPIPRLSSTISLPPLNLTVSLRVLRVYFTWLIFADPRRA